MESVSVSEVKARLSHYLRSVRRGGEVQILDRGVPVARIVGVSQADDGVRQRLVASGAIRPATREVSGLLAWDPIKTATDMVGALEEERADRL